MSASATAAAAPLTAADAAGQGYDRHARRLPGQRPLPRRLMHRIIRLLLAAGSDTERLIVYLRLYHGLDFAAVGERLKLPPAAVRDQFESVAARYRLAHELACAYWPFETAPRGWHGLYCSKRCRLRGHRRRHFADDQTNHSNAAACAAEG